MFDSRLVLDAVLHQYRLDPAGVHGVTHWARVCEHGRLLAVHMAVRVEVVDLFALLHDAGRRTETIDPGHGPRGAALAAELRGRAFDLPDADFALLQEACARHEDGLIEADPTVQACWDADRLDLGRVGIVPRGDRLCTDAARGLAAWTSRRSLERGWSDVLTNEWGWSPPTQTASR